MPHVAEGTLRRLVDDERAVADADIAHVAGCQRCRAREARAAGDASLAARLLVRPQPVPNVDAAWRRLQVSANDGPAVRLAHRALRPGLPFAWTRVPSRAGLASGSLLLGVAAASVLIAVLGPAGPAPAPPSAAGFETLVDTFGIGNAAVLGGFGTLSGTLRLPFGTLRWSADGRPRTVSSLAAAEAITGVRMPGIATLPAGVGGQMAVLVEPRVSATIAFDSAAGRGLEGRSLTVTAGPAVIVEYGGSGGNANLLGRLPVLATVAMPRPTVSSIATTPGVDRLTAFVLSRPEVPGGLAEVLRLAENTPAVLPVSLPAGVGVSQVDVGGSPGVLLAADGGVASGVIWEDRSGEVHAAIGLLDQKDILNVANQLG